MKRKEKAAARGVEGGGGTEHLTTKDKESSETGEGGAQLGIGSSDGGKVGRVGGGRREKRYLST